MLIKFSLVKIVLSLGFLSAIQSASLPINQSVTMPLKGSVTVTCTDGIPYIAIESNHVAVIKCRR